MAYENKTQQTDESVESYLSTIPDEQKRKDSFEIMEMMRTATGIEPKLWSGNLIGFGNYRYKSAAGTEGNWFIIGFAPRKANFSLYLMSGLQAQPDLLKKLGKFKTGKGCLYINKLSDIDKPVLQQLVQQSIEENKHYFNAIPG